MEQQSLDNWKELKKSIDKNRYPRIKWRLLLGMSMTEAASRMRATGLSPEQAVAVMEKEHPDWSDELKRRLRISIQARYSEADTHLRIDGMVKKEKKN